MFNAKQNTEWYLSHKGIAKFAALKNLEERVIFISEYLNSIIDYSNTYDRKDLARINDVTFHFAIFLADAIYGSDLPYSTYPALIDPNKNPFLRTWINYKFGKQADKFSIYSEFTKIIEKENKRRKGDAKTFKQELIDQIGTANAEQYSNQIFSVLPDTAIYDIVPSLQLIQLKNEWFFDRSWEVYY